MKKAAVLLVVFSALVCCKKSEKQNKINPANWLIGSWENNSDQGNLSENWKKQNDSTFIGQSYFIKGKDTLHHESIVLDQKGDDFFYTTTVKGQNNDQAIRFKMTSATAKQLVFENLKHDYPQKIVYNKITKDSLVAKISGIQQGKPSTESFPMKKK